MHVIPSVTASTTEKTQGGEKCGLGIQDLLADVGDEGHESGAFDGFGHCVLTDGGTAAFTPADDFSLPIGQFLKQFHVFIVHIHWPWTLTFDKNGIFLFAADLSFSMSFTDLVNLQFSCHFITRLRDESNLYAHYK